MKDFIRTFRIFRFQPGESEQPRFQEFAIEISTSMSVLDAVEHIRLHEDPSLMYRHSCHHSSCGTCACKINGKARLMCTTKVIELEIEPILLEPLDGLPKKGDLVVDMTGFYGHISEHWRYLHDLSGKAAENMPEGVGTFQRFEACIECGSCVSACPVQAISVTVLQDEGGEQT